MQPWQVQRNLVGTTLPQTEERDYVLYDTLLYTSATTVALTFFNAVRATLDLGNMFIASALPGDHAFIVHAIRVYFKSEPGIQTALPFASASDIARLVNNGFATFTVGNKDEGRWPLVALPGGAGVWGSIAAAGAEAADEFAAIASHGAPDPRAISSLRRPIGIPPQIQFRFDLGWTTAQTLSGNLNILVMLDGILQRPVQ